MDSARSWAVAAACCWINVFTFAMIRSAAVVYVALLRTFPVTREQASWPVNLSVVCYLVTGACVQGALRAQLTQGMRPYTPPPFYYA